MKKLIVLTLVVLGYQVAFAQHKGEERVKERVQHMDEQLDLTEDQEAKITEILTDAQKAIMAIENKKENKDSIKAIKQASREKIQEVLTDEQKEIIKAEHSSRKEEHKAHRDSLLDVRQEFDSKLSAEEKEIITETREKVKAAKKKLKDESLGEEEKKLAREELYAALSQLDPIIENHKEELDALDLKAPKHAKKHRREHKRENKGEEPQKKEMKQRKENSRYYRFLLMHKKA